MCQTVTQVRNLAGGARVRLWRCACHAETQWKLLELPACAVNEDADDDTENEAGWARHDAQLDRAVREYEAALRGDPFAAFQ